LNVRAVSLGIAGVASVIGLVFPFVLGGRPTGLNQTILLVMMVGVAGAFIHGAGFSPRSPWLRAMTAPAACWPLVLAGLGALILLRNR
jgi:predicted membrane protein